MRQEWFCESCKCRGEVEYAEHAGAWEVFGKVAHAHHHDSVGCHRERGVDSVRVVARKKEGSSLDADGSPVDPLAEPIIEGPCPSCGTPLSVFINGVAMRAVRAAQEEERA
jgi:hypothetical protein